LIITLQLPLTESLKLTEARVLKLWNSELVPEIKAGKTLMIAAHGNSLRALVKHLDGISRWVVIKKKKSINLNISF